MAQALDLDEQEQLDKFKFFWKQYGNIITWALIAVLGAYAAWNAYHYWQRQESGQASAMYDTVEQAAQAGDIPKLDRALGDMNSKFGNSLYAQQAGLLAAKVFYDKANPEKAKSALTVVAGQSNDEGYQAIAKLRLASIFMGEKAYDKALAQLSGSFPPDFEPLVADRQGDIFAAQGKQAEAKAAYVTSYKGQSSDKLKTEYIKLLEFKLNALGVDVKSLQPPANAASQAIAPK